MKTKANFEPPTMYHPKTGEAVMANSFEKHLELKNMRYGHSKPAKKKAPKKKAAKKTKSFTEAVESRLGGY